MAASSFRIEKFNGGLLSLGNSVMLGTRDSLGGAPNLVTENSFALLETNDEPSTPMRMRCETVKIDTAIYGTDRISFTTDTSNLRGLSQATT